MGNFTSKLTSVAMGSPLGPLMANAFMCSLEEKLSKSNNLPSFYNRCVDDTLTKLYLKHLINLKKQIKEIRKNFREYLLFFCRVGSGGWGGSWIQRQGVSKI